MKLVTAIMPTRGRSKWAAQSAVSSFLKQSYYARQLLILDDSDEPSFPGGIASTEAVIGYLRLDERLNIPQKRNLLTRVSPGEIIVHWDSDDYSAADRIAEQVKTLEESGKAVTGYNSIVFHEEHTARWGRWTLYPDQAFGTSLCYLKSWWAEHRFNEGLTIGEDNEFVQQANQAGQVVIVPGDKMIVARAHPGNTSPKDMDNCRPIEPSMIPAGFCA